MRSPQKEFRILLPVWGGRYIEQCLSVLLPSLLAQGNLPALASRLPTTLVFLVRSSDVPRLKADSILAELARHATIDFVSIDDLISQASAVVLTLAYARAIRAAGTAMTDTGFFFLVSDYLLADGSLDVVGQRLLSGADGVLAGNFQTVAEEMKPHLVRDGHVLTIAPRDLVRLSLSALHPASRATIVGPRLSHDPNANRLFWPVGEDGLIGRFYLLHMVAIRPEQPTFELTAPSDYGLIPALCPSGRIAVITDSDDYLVVEIQGRGERVPEMAIGSLSPADLAGSLGCWTTRRHRANADHTLVYHAGATGPEFDAARREADRFVAVVAELMTIPPQPDRRNLMFARSLDHHRATASQYQDPAVLSALLGADVAETARPRGLAGLRSALVGRSPHPRPWHPRWVDGRLLAAKLKQICAGRRVKIVSEEPLAMRRFLFDVLRDARALQVIDVDAGVPADGPTASQDCDVAVVLLGSLASDDATAALDVVLGRLDADADIIVVVGDVFSDDLSRVEIGRAAPIDRWLSRQSPDVAIVSVEGVACGPFRAGVQHAMMDRLRQAVRRRGAQVAMPLLAGAALALLSLAANLVALRSGRRDAGQASSAVFLHVRRRAAAKRERTASDSMGAVPVHRPQGREADTSDGTGMAGPEGRVRQMPEVGALT